MCLLVGRGGPGLLAFQLLLRNPSSPAKPNATKAWCIDYSSGAMNAAPAAGHARCSNCARGDQQKRMRQRALRASSKAAALGPLVRRSPGHALTAGQAQPSRVEARILVVERWVGGSSPLRVLCLLAAQTLPSSHVVLCFQRLRSRHTTSCTPNRPSDKRSIPLGHPSATHHGCKRAAPSTAACAAAAAAAAAASTAGRHADIPPRAAARRGLAAIDLCGKLGRDAREVFARLGACKRIE